MQKEQKVNLFKSLIRILDKEIQVYQKMVAVIREKQDMIVIGDVNQLRELVNREKSLIKESMKIAKLRREAQLRLSQHYRLSESEPRLKQLIEIAGPGQAITLSNLRYRLKGMLNQITRINNENKLLLNFSIEHVKGLAHLFLNINEEPSGIYGMDGVVRVDQKGNKVLDFQI